MRYDINIENFSTNPPNIQEFMGVESDSPNCKAEMLRQFRLAFPQSKGINFTGKELNLSQIYIFPTKHPESGLSGRIIQPDGKAFIVQVFNCNN